MPQEATKANWISLSSIWIGGMVSIPSLLIGSTLIAALDFQSTFWAGFLGIAFVAAFMSLESVAAARHNLNTVQLGKCAFGSKGSAILIGTIVGLATMGWFGVQTNVAGISFSAILKETFSIEVPEWVSSAFWGMIMLVTAVYGVKLMKWLNYIAVPAIILLMSYGLVVSFQGKGWDEVLAYHPPQGMNILSAIGLAIGFVSVGGVIAPDVNRFAASRKDAVLGSVFGLLPAGVLLLVVGAILGILQGTHDITAIFSQLGYPVLALSILILATWTTNVINAYSGGLALNQLLMRKESQRAVSTLIAGLVGTGLAIAGILNHFMSFLMTLTVAIPPIAGVLISDYWVAKSFQTKVTKPVNWKGSIAWGVGVLTMLLMEDPLKNILAIFISGGSFWLLEKGLKQTKEK